ncbi:hypothetical protein OSTOST_02881, partial [Ostertagia ostertagi]
WCYRPKVIGAQLSSNSYRLRNSSFKNIFVRKSMTTEERSRELQLRQECKARNDQLGNRRAVIRLRFPVCCWQLFKLSTEKQARTYIGRMSRKREDQPCFFDKYRILGIAGVVDGTHCRIQRPHVAEGDYVNRKGYRSLNVGMVVDYDLRIRWVNSKWYVGASRTAEK